MNREDALKKIKKCLALSRSANEHEAATALRQAQKLMAEFGLAEQDVSLADVWECRAKALTLVTVNAWEVSLVSTIADAFACEYFTRNRWGSQTNGSLGYLREWVFVGIDSAPEVAAYACDVLTRQCKIARQAHVAKQPKNCKAITKTARGDAFAQGWAWGVRQKIMAFAPQKNEALLLAYMNANHPNMTTGNTRDTTKKKKRVTDGHMTAGYSAGLDAQLNHAVGGAGGERRLLT